MPASSLRKWCMSAAAAHDGNVDNRHRWVSRLRRCGAEGGQGRNARMMNMSKRQLLQMLGLGASAIGMAAILGSPVRAATGTLPAWAALPEGAAPKTGGKLVYG